MPVKSKQSRPRLNPADDAPPLTRKWVRGADLYVGKQLVRRGRPAGTATKTQTTIRLSNVVLEYFKTTGAGWQTRLDGVLKHYVATRRRRESI